MGDVASIAVRTDRTRKSWKIGVFGGTFDPPHLGHVGAALAGMDQLGLDRVLFVVSNHPWQKVPVHPVSPALDRLAMVEALVSTLPGLEASRLEIERGGPSYTIETVEEIFAQEELAGHLQPEIFVIIGSDLLETVPTWEKSEQLRKIVTVAVVTRPGSIVPVDLPGWSLVRVEGPGVDVSSSEVREVLSARSDSSERLEELAGKLSESVIHLIRSRNLYAGTR